MSDSPLDLEVMQDYAVLSPQAVVLLPHQVDQALQWSRTASNEVQQWRLYRQGLALVGFEQWLQEREPLLPIQRARGAVPTDVPLVAAVANLQVGEFQLCLLPRGSFLDHQISVPCAVVDLPDFVPHFYVVVEVQEELEQVRITTVLSHERLVQYQQGLPLTTAPDWTYEIPSTWFADSADQLLLWLRCLQPTAISVPRPMAVPSLTQGDLKPLLPMLRASDEVWPVLSWSQGAALLQDHPLQQWLRQELQSSDLCVSSDVEAVEPWVLPSFLQPINTALWLQQVLEDVAREWVLISPALALRSRQPEITAMLEKLRQRGVMVPEYAGAAYRELGLDTTLLRLYTLVWPLGDVQEQPEWTLLLVLGPQSETDLNHPVRLMVRDVNQILTDAVLMPDSEETYLYTQVIGAWNEQFWVTIGFDLQVSATAVQLAPFRFDPPLL